MALPAVDLALSLSELTEPNQLHAALAATWAGQHPPNAVGSQPLPSLLDLAWCTTVCGIASAAIRRGVIAAFFDDGREKARADSRGDSRDDDDLS
jgi:hypothetical protein